MFAADTLIPPAALSAFLRKGAPSRMTRFMTSRSLSRLGPGPWWDVCNLRASWRRHQGNALKAEAWLAVGGRRIDIMVGKIFITRSGYDPQLGKHVKDPYLGPNPTLGACRPDIRRRLSEGDHIFVISGRVQEAPQFVMAGFEVDAKIDAVEAYRLFPHLRLRKLPDGQLTGNIIVNAAGERHELDDHKSFESRITNFIVGRNLIALETPEEIATGRAPDS